MRSKISPLLFLTAAVLLALITACQQPTPIEYKSYATDAEIPRISVEDAKKEFDSGAAIIVDARDSGSYNAEHVTGSINLQSVATDADMAKLPKGKKIIVYCS